MDSNPLYDVRVCVCVCLLWNYLWYRGFGIIIYMWLLQWIHLQSICVAISGPRLFVYVYAFRSGRRYTLLFAHKLRFWFNLEQKKEKKFGNKSKCTALLIESFSLYLSRYVVVFFFSSLQRERLMKNKLEMKWFSMALDNTKANCKRSMSMREKCWISLGWPSERSHALSHQITRTVKW